MSANASRCACPHKRLPECCNRFAGPQTLWYRVRTNRRAIQAVNIKSVRITPIRILSCTLYRPAPLS